MTVLSPDAVDVHVDGPAGALSVRARGLHPGARSAVVLVQGALLSGQTAFDIPVGPPDLSLLQVLTGYGHAAVTFAIRGYGTSEPPPDPLALTTEDATADLAAVVAWTREQTGLSRVSVFGWSWGGRIAAHFTAQNPDLVERLVMMDPALGGTPPHPEWTPTTPYKELTVEEYRSRVEPQYTDPEINELVASYAAATDLRAPQGVSMEMAGGAPAANPEQITRPTLMVYGTGAAKAAYMQGAETREHFFGRIAADERVFAVIPDGGDYLQFQRGRFGFHQHLGTFLAPALGASANEARA